MAEIILRGSRPAGPIYGLTNAEVDSNFKNINDELVTKQQQLVSGQNIKTINGASVLGNGNLEVTGLPGKDGKDGTNGTNGVNGLSAYQIAVTQGYVGTEAQWLLSLHGKDGTNGLDGAPGADGADGADGTSFTVDAVGTFSERGTYDNEPVGFSFLATDVGEMYFREGESGGWSSGVPFGRGEKGEKGDPGEPGAPGIDGTDGTNGVDGKDGAEVVIQKQGDSIVWNHVGDEDWNILVPLIEITGAPGADGTNGTDGVDGKQIEIDVINDHIVWRYAGDLVWIDLVPLADITGPQGIQGVQGIQGIQGKNVELQANTTHIQWRVAGDTSWTNLVAKSELKGDTGAPGTTTWSGITGKPTTLSGFGIANFKADEGLAENINLATVITSGIYRYNTSSDGPPGVLYSPMLVSRANDTCSQLIFDYSSGVVYSRCGIVRNNTLVMPITESGPPPWRRIANTNDPAKGISNNEINLLAGGNYFVDAVTTNKTYTVTNQYPNATFIVELTHTAGAINFPFAIWPNDSPPTLTVNRRHIFEFRLPSTPNAWMVRHLGSYSL